MSVLTKEIKQADTKQNNVVEIINPEGIGRFVLVCEHASNFIPEHHKNLGLAVKARNSHVAWDPGARDVAIGLSNLLESPLVASCVSRLVYDCNRPPTAKSSIPERSEIIDIKGNINLSKDEVNERALKYYFPFRNALSECLGSHSLRSATTILVTLHTFTPVFQGRERTVELGVIHDNDNRMADGVLTSLNRLKSHKVERNQPYSPRDGVTHTLKEHGNKRGIANVMIEIKNDLVSTNMQRADIVSILGSALNYAADNLDH